jgi:hypothetical protein
MAFNDSSFWIFWKEYGKHIEAFLIITLLITTIFVYYNNNKLQKEINKNCGWETETYRCICGKDLVIPYEIKLNTTKEINFDIKLDK